MVTLELRPSPLLPELVDFFSFSYFPKKERVIFQCLHILCAAQKDPHATFVKE
jgi:hypothetical protein